MQIKFDPIYIISLKTMSSLLRIESCKEKILHLPLTPTVLQSLRENSQAFYNPLFNND